MTDVADLHLGSSDPMSDEIRRVASHVGIDLVVHDSETGITAVGDVDIPEGAATWLIEAALLRAAAPKHILFLCVANSARSQLAEGIARSLAPTGVKISSAGSAPTSVRPQAITVLDEVGIDISRHTSIGIDEVERPVDAVITLCAAEVCPVWLEDVARLHWGLPDPAAVAGDEEQRLAAFRSVRDELTRRLQVMLG